MNQPLRFIKQVFIRLFGPKSYWRAKSLLDRFYDSYRNTTYSQFGEDVFLRKYFNYKSNGFFVDIGAFHPVQFSNTYALYKTKNWSGINIDARPNSKILFDRIRPNDCNVEALVSNKKEEFKYYSWGDHSENTIIENQAQALTQRLGPPLEVKNMTSRPLYEILDEYAPKNSQIDFISVDVEGHDLEVLKSNNWELYSPRLVLTEGFFNNVDEVINSELYKFLIDQKYHLKAWLNPTLVFEKN
ncbi:MAG: FkbM family methyltransferase [Bdellovibrionales bacterium]